MASYGEVQHLTLSTQSEALSFTGKVLAAYAGATLRRDACSPASHGSRANDLAVSTVAHHLTR